LRLLSHAVRFPAERPASVRPAKSLGLHARARALDNGMLMLSVQSRRMAYGVRVHVPGFSPDDELFSIVSRAASAQW